MKSRTSSTPNISRRRSRGAVGVSLAKVRTRTREQDSKRTLNRIPGATCRLQFNATFTLQHAGGIVDYLRALGVTDVYASPLLQAGPESTHGYDTCSHSRIGACLGGDEAFQRFSDVLHGNGMGLVLDIVPNHMGACAANAWWWDVLKRGQQSPFAKLFDIDWQRGGGRIVLPVLGDELEKIRAARQLSFSSDAREFLLNYFENRFPLSPRSFASPEVLDQQHYRLVHWMRGADEINYRRFFDVDGLVALRMEDARVFAMTHRRVLELVRRGRVTGLRVDHPDGLCDPQEYFERLQARCGKRRLFVVAEKILSGDEPLPGDWPIAGTTGYDFLNDVNGLFVSRGNERPMTEIYHDFTGCTEEFTEIAYKSKKRVLHKSFAGDVQALANRLATAVGENAESLRDALFELIACFPVYRTYVRAETTRLSAADIASLTQAFAAARLRAATLEPEFDSLEEILFLRRNGAGLREFILRFQQLTGPAAAKGIEDTAFYRFNRLVSLNEVGGEPARFGISSDEFHARNRERAKHWPHTLLATATHDTKRGEDTRARINVLSEIPAAWREAVFRWRDLNAAYKTDVNGAPAPDANDEYLFYQTLVGTWTAEGSTENYRGRIAEYMAKAIKESKRHTSWTEPNEGYEVATRRFIESVLAPSNGKFLGDFVEFQRKVAFFGIFNSLSQTLLKLTSPGVPDIYQGTELWDFSLVDPDNRRSVDFSFRKKILEQLRSADRPHLEAEAQHGAVKMFLIQRTLEIRNRHRQLFDRGDYLPLQVNGSAREHVCAFARVSGRTVALTLAPRLACTLVRGKEVPPVGERVWRDTKVVLPPQLAAHRWLNVLTGECLDQARRLSLGEVLNAFPVALLIAS
jgi:(1->4)-alpha-D-glucan 1-alpha-D-glucosylmutase